MLFSYKNEDELTAILIVWTGDVALLCLADLIRCVLIHSFKFTE
jgi:hypothetical protein